MDQHIQLLLGFLMSILIFFILPIYIAYEKRDDLSYSLALKSTTEFVEASRIRGYISHRSYNNYLLQLGATGNAYDIKMEHKAKRFYPVINAYKDNTYSEITMQFDYDLFKNKIDNNNQIVYGGQVYRNIKIASREVTEIYNERQILEVINRSDVIPLSDISTGVYISLAELPNITNVYGTTDSELNSIYTMNIGDEFNIRIRNRNTTLATTLFNTFTIGSAGGENTRVYVNYGGTVVSENYVYLN